MIPVTKSFLPPREEFDRYIDQIWESRYVTNRGPLVQELEAKIQKDLNTREVLLVNNGTIAIQVAIKALGLTGEIITTPFSYVATTSSIVWENCTPVFVDISSDYLTIDEDKIEEAITEKTSAIIATHVYGNPCNIKQIKEIAEKYNLKVIYDAAHCFGVTFEGESLFNYGDVSTCSLHATKIFHCGEGGAIFCNKSDYENLFYHHNFGHKGPLEFTGLGTNAKLSELNAALGLAIFPYFEMIYAARKKNNDQYDHELAGLDIRQPRIRANASSNYSYYPIIFSSEKVLNKVERDLRQHEIFARRYFYPSLNYLPYVKQQPFPVCDQISASILCLPLYHDLKEEEVKLVSQIIRRAIH